MTFRRNGAAAPNDSRRWVVLGALLVALLACWNCRGVLGYQLLAWDDDINITFNPYLGPPTWSRLHWMFTDFDYMRRYLPIGWLGLSSVHAISGIDPFGYHAANLLLHAINSALLLGVIWSLLRRWSPAFEDRWSVACAVIAAASWALHPFRNETVGWASGQLYALGAMFGLLALFARCGIRENTRTRRWLVTGCYVLSLLTYPVAFGLVVVFLLLDLADRPASSGRLRGEILLGTLLANFWILLAAGASLVGTVVARYSSNTFWTPPAAVESSGLWERGMRGVCAGVYYLWRFWWPVDLTPAPTNYLYFNAHGFLALASLGIGLGTAFFAWRWRIRQPGLLLFWISYLALLVPFVGLTENIYFPCDRYAYLPTMAIAVAIAFALNSAVPRWRMPSVVLAAAVIAAFGFQQRVQLPVWKDTAALYNRITALARNAEYRNFIYQKWMMFHAQRGEIAAARNVLAAAAKSDPGSPRLAAMSATLARYEFAASQGWPATADVALAADLHLEAAVNFARKKQVDVAAQHFSAALALAPSSARIRYDFCVFRALDGEADDALHLFLGLGNASSLVSAAAKRRALTLIAEAFFANGRREPARRVIELALRETGGEADAAGLRALLGKYRGRPEGA